MLLRCSKNLIIERLIWPGSAVTAKMSPVGKAKKLTLQLPKDALTLHEVMSDCVPDDSNNSGLKLTAKSNCGEKDKV